jgi:hypothetical protein
MNITPPETTPPSFDPDQLATIAETAQLLRFCTRSITRLVKAKKLKLVYPLPRCPRITRQSIRDFLAAKRCDEPLLPLNLPTLSASRKPRKADPRSATAQKFVRDLLAAGPVTQQTVVERGAEQKLSLSRMQAGRIASHSRPPIASMALVRTIERPAAGQLPQPETRPCVGTDCLLESTSCRSRRGSDIRTRRSHLAPTATCSTTTTARTIEPFLKR